jgi:hypothetical protein
MSRITNAINTLSWLFKHKNLQIPYEKKDDKSFIEWVYNYRSKLAQFKNIHKDEDCFIIGNGPSLNKMDLNPLNDYYTFGLNKIYLLFEKVNLNLTYLAAVNPLVIEQSIETYQNMNCPIFLSYSNSLGLLDNEPHVYKLLTDAQWSFYHSICQPISEGYTVTYIAMQIAYFMGFKRVFLIGVDHNFVQSGKPNEQQVYKGDDQNHFHPDYFKGQSWHLADLEGNEASYALARHQFHASGRQIFDATVGGKLTIFPKITFEEALQIAKKKVRD